VCVCVFVYIPAYKYKDLYVVFILGMCACMYVNIHRFNYARVDIYTHVNVDTKSYVCVYIE